MRLPSSIAAAVVLFGTSNFKEKGIPCSRIVVINEHLILNAESKYQFLDEGSQVHFSIGVSYLF